MRFLYSAFFADALLRRVLTYAVVLYGAEVLGKGAWSGVLYVCLVAPYLLSLYAGGIIDRVACRTVLQRTSILSILLMAGLTLCASHSTPLPWIVAFIVLCYGAVSAFAYPAFMTSVSEIFEPELVKRSTVVMNVLSLLSQVVGPVVVGVLRALVGWPEFFVATIVLGVVQWIALRAVHQTHDNHTRAWGRPLASITPGMAEVLAYGRKHRTLPTLFLAVALFSALAIGPLEVLLPLFAAQTLALHPLAAGMFVATGGLGLVIGALGAIRIVEHANTGLWTLGCAVAGSGAVVLMTTAPRPIAFALVLAGGALGGVFSSLSLAGVQAAATNRLRGRVLGIFSLVLGAPPALGGAAAGALSDSLGTPVAMRIMFGVVAIAFLVVGATRPALRQPLHQT